VRLLGRFPQQQPFELFEELVCFSAAQLGLDAGLIELYRKRQPTISEHQQTITGYLRLRPFDDAEAAQLEQFLFQEACRLEQAAALIGQAREFLKERRVLEPAEFRFTRIVGEQRTRARLPAAFPFACWVLSVEQRRSNKLARRAQSMPSNVLSKSITERIRWIWA
jgi:Domain of unknown function (DUF4158)